MKVAYCVSTLKSGHKDRGIGSYTKSLLSKLKDIMEVQEFEKIDEVTNTDVVFYPFFDLFKASLPLKKRYSTVVMIHDVIPLLFPKFYPAGVKGKINLYRQILSLGSVSAVVTNSEVSKRDIAKYLKIDLGKIYPIFLAAGDQFKKISDKNSLNKVKLKYKLPDRFVLYVGGVNFNKNILNIAEACKRAGVNLVLVGSGFSNRDSLNHPELKSFAQFIKNYSNDSQIHILGFVPDEDLVSIYNLADMLLLVSFYEGFGLPILEAQACGVPVITSSVSSMPEVAGDGAILVDPENVSSISEAIMSVNKNEKLRKELVVKGFLNNKKYSWDKSAKETFEVLTLAKNNYETKK